MPRILFTRLCGQRVVTPRMGVAAWLTEAKELVDPVE
jgi:hypothetical protein